MPVSFAPRPPRDLALAGFLASALLVAGLAGGTYWLSVQERNAQSWISRTEASLTALASTQAHLAQLQDAVRGFVISGAEGDLAAYDAARAALRADAARLQDLTAGNAAQQERARQLQEQLAPRAQAADAVIASRRAGGFEAARAAMEQHAAAARQGRLRDVLGGMEAEERQVLARRLARHDARLAAFWAALAACVAGWLAALATIYRQIRRHRALEQALLEGEQQFHFMTDSITECAVLMLDLQGRVRTWNPGAQRIKGYTAAEVIGRHFSLFYPQQEAAAGVPGENLRMALREGTTGSEGWRLRKDGSRFWAKDVINNRKEHD
jgi:PAS domain S-box-containing protein